MAIRSMEPETMTKVPEVSKHIPIEIIFAAIAVAGGIARYLNGYANGIPFKFGIFCASAFVAGFSGYMMALAASTFTVNNAWLFMAAGTGGFFGEQSMRFLIEVVQRRMNTT